MNELTYNPIQLGKEASGHEPIMWKWNDELHATLAIVGADNGPRYNLVNRIITEVQNQDADSTFHITQSNQVVGVRIDSNAILVSESFPDPHESFEDRQTFINIRRNLSSSYFNLFAKDKGLSSRSELLPATSYRWHAEGPLNGYIRTINELPEENPYKQDLLNELEMISSVPWYKSKDHGTVYYLESDGSDYKKAISFLRGVWSYWAMVGCLENPQQMLLVVDTPSDLLNNTVEPAVASVMDLAFNILRYLAYETTVSLLLSSERMYPAPEKQFRYKIVFSAAEQTDFDLNSDSIKPAVNPLVFDMWQKGDVTAGVHFDGDSQTVIIPERL
ncbi:hypothetical protein [Paenibacillus sp. Y412MC10]|uniref:hypothetical protein n=1 Tax=Geobacillus sp. (strain Y412MC10) TaxID=481743 RepID=UPI0011AB7A49|nr:hypothetical protein [Paenibacillus sp. Y412MC10]